MSDYKYESAAYLPKSSSGLSGVIVAKSTEGGRSLAVDPNKPSVVVIDPDHSGSSLTIDSSELNSELIADAIKQAASAVKNINDRDPREVVYNTFKILKAKLDKKKENNVASNSKQKTNPLSGVKSPKQRYNPDNDYDNSPVPEDNDSTTPPSCKVTFEVEGFGLIEATYHDVVKGDDNITLVLVYDTNYTYGVKYFPQASNNPLYINVQSMDSVYRVRSAGLKFSFSHYDFCILFIDNTANKPDEDE